MATDIWIHIEYKSRKKSRWAYAYEADGERNDTGLRGFKERETMKPCIVAEKGCNSAHFSED